MEISAFSFYSIQTIIIRLVLSSVIGFLIGINREWKNRGAGTRTHAIVCMAACLISLLSIYIAEVYPDFAGDITRLGSNVITGMGFIGAGSIIITRYNHVRGITTAASLWATACIGLAVGFGFLTAAVAAGALMMFILIVIEETDKALKPHSTVHDYLIVFCDTDGFSIFLNELKNSKIKIDNIEIQHADDESGPIVYITLESEKDMTEFMLELQSRIRIKMLNEI